MLTRQQLFFTLEMHCTLIALLLSSPFIDPIEVTGGTGRGMAQDQSGGSQVAPEEASHSAAHTKSAGSKPSGYQPVGEELCGEQDAWCHGRWHGAWFQGYYAQNAIV